MTQGGELRPWPKLVNLLIQWESLQADERTMVKRGELAVQHGLEPNWRRLDDYIAPNGSITGTGEVLLANRGRRASRGAIISAVLAWAEMPREERAIGGRAALAGLYHLREPSLVPYIRTGGELTEDGLKLVARTRGAAGQAYMEARSPTSHAHQPAA